MPDWKVKRISSSGGSVGWSWYILTHAAITMNTYGCHFRSKIAVYLLRASTAPPVKTYIIWTPKFLFNFTWNHPSSAEIVPGNRHLPNTCLSSQFAPNPLQHLIPCISPEKGSPHVRKDTCYSLSFSISLKSVQRIKQCRTAQLCAAPYKHPCAKTHTQIVLSTHLGLNPNFSSSSTLGKILSQCNPQVSADSINNSLFTCLQSFTAYGGQ